MEDSTTKEKVLKNSRFPLSKSPNPFPQLEIETSVFAESTKDAVVEFGNQVTAAGANFSCR